MEIRGDHLSPGINVLRTEDRNWRSRSRNRRTKYSRSCPRTQTSTFQSWGIYISDRLTRPPPVATNRDAQNDGGIFYSETQKSACDKPRMDYGNLYNEKNNHGQSLVNLFLGEKKSTVKHRGQGYDSWIGSMPWRMQRKISWIRPCFLQKLVD